MDMRESFPMTSLTLSTQHDKMVLIKLHGGASYTDIFWDGNILGLFSDRFK